MPQEKEEAWWINPPQHIEGKLYFLQIRAGQLRAPTEEGVVLRQFLEDVQEAYNNTLQQVKELHPIAFFKPSYEQSLLLNAWWCGITFVICFAANRIGKTTSLGVINPLLWTLPNNPEWEMFSPSLRPDPATQGATFITNDPEHQQQGFYLDLLGRKVQVLPRPSLEDISLLQSTIKNDPTLRPDPALPHTDPHNFSIFASLQKLIRPAWPRAPIAENGTIWLGAPDQGFHRDIIFKEWRRWLPKHTIKKWSDADLYFHLDTTDSTNPQGHEWQVICKSYESDDTKWSGSAVHGIVLTEGLTAAVLNEIKQRIKSPGFGSWDYTPYEARNSGQKTALAYQVFKGTEQMPLQPHIFTKFSARNAPAHILPTAKKDDMIRMWEGKKEGDARLEGLFYSSSPLVLSRLDRAFHTVPWSFAELQSKYPSGQIYRGFDPGYDHPSCCVWGYLVPGNIWFIYRYYTARGTTITQRCQEIINLSGNKQQKRKWGKGPDDYNLIETHPYPHSEPAVLTAADFHLFKQDEVTGQNYTLNYIKQGLVLTESTHMRPEDRAADFDSKLERSQIHTHPLTGSAPGARVFFLINGPGVDSALGKMESLFWERLHGGPNKGEAKDTVPSHGDDELDATCYLVCGPYVWTRYRPVRLDNFQQEQELESESEPGQN